MDSRTLRPKVVQPAMAALAEAGISQNQLAKRTGIPRNNLNQALNGRRAPSLAMVEALEEATGLPVEELFHEDAYARSHWRVRELKTGSRRPGGDEA